MSRADFSELLPTFGGFAFAAYACFLLGRPDIRAQFNVDSGSSGRQNFATVIFAVVAVVIFVTCYVELTTQAPDETSAAAGGSGATSAAAPGSGATFSFIARSASRRSSRRGSSGASAPERLSAPGRPDFATDARYDQPHLNRDFHELAGLTPTEYLGRLFVTPGGRQVRG